MRYWVFHGKQETRERSARRGPIAERSAPRSETIFFLTSSDTRLSSLLSSSSLSLSLPGKKKQTETQDLTYTVRSNASRRLKVDLLKVRENNISSFFTATKTRTKGSTSLLFSKKTKSKNFQVGLRRPPGLLAHGPHGPLGLFQDHAPRRALGQDDGGHAGQGGMRDLRRGE